MAALQEGVSNASRTWQLVGAMPCPSRDPRARGRFSTYSTVPTSTSRCRFRKRQRPPDFNTAGRSHNTRLAGRTDRPRLVRSDKSLISCPGLRKYKSQITRWTGEQACRLFCLSVSPLRARDRVPPRRPTRRRKTANTRSLDAESSEKAGGRADFTFGGQPGGLRHYSSFLIR